MAFADFQAEQDRQAAAAKAAAASAAPAVTAPAQIQAAPLSSSQSPAASAAQSSPASTNQQNDGGWLHWLATKGMGQDYQRSIEKGMTLGLGDDITGGIMGAGKAAVTGDASSISDEIARQRADTAAARERIGPVGRAATDVVSQFMPAQRALGSVPYVGPILQGGVQAGGNAYGEGKTWPTIGTDAALGGVAGLASLGASQVARPSVVRNVLGYGLDTGVPGLVGGYLGGSLEHGLLGAAVGKPMLSSAGNYVRGLWPNADWSGAREALQNILLGGAQSGIQGRGGQP